MKSVEALRLEAGGRLNLRWTVLADLSPENRERLYDEMADVVLASPGDYAGNLIDWAVSRRSSGVYRADLPSYSLADGARDFAGEFLNQAAGMDAAFNPFSSGNRNKVAGALLLTVLVGGLLYVVGPPLIAAFRS